MRSRMIIGTLLSVASCTGERPDPAGPGGTPVALEVAADDSTVAAGARLQLRATVRDAAGRTLAGITVQWASLDTTTATAAADGSVRGERIGFVRVEARAAGLADTIRLRVRPPALTAGQLFLRRDGPSATSGSWDGGMRYDDILATDTGEVTRLFSRSAVGGRDSVFAVSFPGRITAGRMPLEPYPLGGTWARSGPLVLLDMGNGADREIRVGISGEVVFSAVTWPAAPGLESGVADGYADVRAVLVAFDAAGAPYLTADTADLHVAFRLHLQHLLHGNVAVTLSGGPVQGAASGTSAQGAFDSRGGLAVWWDVDADRAPGQAYRFEYSHEVRIPALHTGTFTVGAITPPAWFDPARWSGAFSSIGYRDDPRIGLSTGGTVTITGYTAPTDAYYGSVTGIVTADLALWSDTVTVTADTVHAVATFAVQLWPLAGIPAVAAGGRGIPGSVRDAGGPLTGREARLTCRGCPPVSNVQVP